MKKKIVKFLIPNANLIDIRKIYVQSCNIINAVL